MRPNRYPNGNRRQEIRQHDLKDLTELNAFLDKRGKQHILTYRINVDDSYTVLYHTYLSPDGCEMVGA